MSEPDRDKLRKRLRDKIRHGRQTAAPPARPDLQTMLLASGIDDPKALEMAGKIGSHPSALRDHLKNLTGHMGELCKQVADDDDDPGEALPPTLGESSKTPAEKEKEEEEEELPPGL